MRDQPKQPRPAQGTLYGRALLFVVLGSGAFLGALLMMSSLVVDGARRRLLDERMALANAVARLLENRLQTDIDRMVDAARLLLRDRSARESDLGPVLLQTAVRAGSLAEGAFVLDGERQALVGAPDASDRVWTIDGLDAILSRVSRTKQVELTSLVEASDRPVVVAVAPVLGRRRTVVGFAVGLLQPVQSDLLEAIRDTSLDAEADVGLLDSAGVHIAATEPRHLFEHTTKNGPLERAIRARQPFRGVHECDATHGSEGLREVVAFGPMTKFGLSVIVVQPEATALAPAFELRRRLFGFGAPLIVLFVAFSLLSVHSVVLPVRALTLAVRRTKGGRKPLKIDGFTRDEVGELASSMHAWHRAMVESLVEVEDHRASLDRETQAMRRYLEALRAVSDASTADLAVQPMLQVGLHHALELMNASRGALALDRGGQQTVAVQGLDVADGRAVLDVALRSTKHPCGELMRLDGADLAAVGDTARAFCQDCGSGIRLGLVGVDVDEPGPQTLVWLSNLLQHVCACAFHQMFRDADRERREQQERYLHQVLRAQEDERSRVARDLHDTVAQDLAALRLDAERLAARSKDDEMHGALVTLEARSREMLVTVRRILLDLRLSILEGEGLFAAIRQLLDRAREQAGLHTHLFVDGDESTEIGYASAIALFRVTQEALLNVVQHAQAERVLATITVGTDTIDLTIEDDGRGFEPLTGPVLREDRTRQGRGLGILGMKERASLVGGSLRIESTPGEGSTVYVSVPIDRAAASTSDRAGMEN